MESIYNKHLVAQKLRIFTRKQCELLTIFKLSNNDAKNIFFERSNQYFETCLQRISLISATIWCNWKRKTIN